MLSSARRISLQLHGRGARPRYGLVALHCLWHAGSRVNCPQDDALRESAKTIFEFGSELKIRVEFRQAAVEFRQAAVEFRQAAVEFRQAAVEFRQAAIEFRQAADSLPEATCRLPGVSCRSTLPL